MKFNDKGLALLKEFEGCRLKAYPDPGTGGEPWTIGYGHIGGVNEGDVITQSQADSLLAADLAHLSAQVDAALTVELTDNQFSSLVCFAYNVGIGNLRNSMLLHLVNQGQLTAAAGQFERWDRAAGHIMPGLLRRRQAEKALFLAA